MDNRSFFNASVVLSLLAALFFSCSSNAVVDTNESLPDNNWEYRQSARVALDVKDSLVAYNIRFKLRHTASYRYANMYVLFTLKGPGLNKTTRYQFKLAQSDGLWLGKGSGDIYQLSFPLLSNFYFPKMGKYQLEIEQNMRDNPLAGISDVGLRIIANSPSK